MRYAYCMVLCVLCIGLWTLSYGETRVSKETSKKDITVPQLASINSEDRLKLLEQLSKDRYSLQGALISQLNESNPKEVTFSIAYLLGLNRMEGSVQELSKHIALEADMKIETHLGLWSQYPVVDALINIGNPAVPEMLKNIETSQDKKVRELSAGVVRYVMGSEIAKIVLEKAMQDKSDAVKANFDAAIESIKDVPMPVAKPITDRRGVPATRPAP